ncbi:tRNA (pseudouridine(54)-N(1))-methyltransferase TrmY [Halobacteriales archaeon QS_4_62_28]|nr:MAG: tRNA (pseudouridine(54)-N(1))-methyltransferase TrmY [Halobacteriales archaeon QS_4_62_28]
MRQFVIIGHDAPTTAAFSLDDLAGGAGRLDVLCRCVSAAFFLSHDIREDVRVHLVLGGEYTITFDGRTVRRLNPDERSTAALVRNALEEREAAIGHVPVETSPGVSLTRRGFASTLDDAGADGTVVQLHENGDPVVDTEPPDDPVFVLSDHRSFTAEESETLGGHTDRRVSLGPKPLHANHAITVAHNFLDTDGFQSH